MKNIVIVLLALSISIMACQPAADDTMRTPEGFKIEFVEGPSDSLVSAGDLAKFYIQVSSQDSMLLPSPQKQELQIPQGEDPGGIVSFVSMMGEGDSAIIYIPYDSLTERQRTAVKPDQSLNYHIGVYEVVDSSTYIQQMMVEQQAAMKKIAMADSIVQEKLEAYKNNNLEGLKESNSGIEYIILEEGTGPPVGKGETVTVDYYGVLMSNGQMFDNSLSRDQKFTFTVGQGQVIQGWDEGLQFMNYGGEGILFIPSNLAYGEQGSGPIEPNSDLAFYVMVEEK